MTIVLCPYKFSLQATIDRHKLPMYSATTAKFEVNDTKSKIPLLKISLKFVLKVRIYNIPALVHYLKQWWLVYWRMYAPLGLNELTSMDFQHGNYLSIEPTGPLCIKGVVSYCKISWVLGQILDIQNIKNFETWPATQ